MVFFLSLSLVCNISYRTSATTMRVAGVVKDWLLISLSAIWFKSPLSVLNVVGYAIAFIGVIMYNFFKQQVGIERKKKKRTGVCGGMDEHTYKLELSRICSVYCGVL